MKKKKSIVFGFSPLDFDNTTPGEFYRWDEDFNGMIPLKNEEEQAVEKIQAAFDSIVLVEDTTTPEEDYVLKVLGEDKGRIIMKLIDDIYYDPATKEIVLVYAGHETRIDVRDLVDIYSGDETTIHMDNHVFSIHQNILDILTTIQNDLAKETQDRIIGDNNLDTKINQEIQDRTDADNALDAKIEKEIQDRKDADDEIKSMLTQWDTL